MESIITNLVCIVQQCDMCVIARTVLLYLDPLPIDKSNQSSVKEGKYCTNLTDKIRYSCVLQEMTRINQKMTRIN